MLANDLRQEKRRNRSDHEGDRGQAQRVSQSRPITILSLWKGAQKVCDPRTKVNRQAEDRAQLNHDRVHLPVSVAQADVKERLGNSQMRGGTDG